MTDANQVWDVQETVDWMKELAEVKPLWIEEPTSPDDILGHAEISRVCSLLSVLTMSTLSAGDRPLFVRHSL